MDDDRRSYGSGEPPSWPPPPGSYDGHADRPEPDAAHTAEAAEGSGPHPEAPRPYAPPAAPQAQPQRPAAGDPGPSASAEPWQRAAPSSPYTIPGPNPAASAPGEDRSPAGPPEGEPYPREQHAAPPPPEGPPRYAPVGDQAPYGQPPEAREPYPHTPDPAPGHYTPPGGHDPYPYTPDQAPGYTPPGGHDPYPYAPDQASGYTPHEGREPFAPPEGRDPFATQGASHYTDAPPAAASAAPPAGAVFSRGGGADGAPPFPPETGGYANSGAPEPGPGGYPDYPQPPRRSRKGLVIGIVSGVVALALVGGAASWYILNLPQPGETASAYTRAWSSQDYAAMADLSTGGDAGAALKRLDGNLGVDKARITTGEVAEDGDTATVPFDATLTLSNAGEWSYSGKLPLVQEDGEWKVDFSPAAMHPDLGEGQTLVRTNEWGERGHILASDGTRLDTGSASGSVQMILGEVGTVTEENKADLGPAYEIGDPVGVSGVQAAYEERLAGEAATAIRVVDTGTEPKDVPEDAATVGTLKGQDGKDVTLSLDPAVQAAAAQAIVGQSKPTAMVAIRPSTGEVLAAANVPGGFNRALDGQYPAGSIFKIISYNALLDSGMGMGAQMSCPKTAEVGGRTYKNAGDAAYGAQTVTEAFATSCNTALVQEVANRLDGASLLKSAETFGFNSDFHSGLSVFKPSLPKPDSVSLLTASSIGQGQVLTSPLHMATLPAAVADGSWRAPLLVTEPKPADRPEPAKIGNAPNLRDMTRAVVTEGTAKNVGFTGEVHGKSGTAEYGTAEEGEELPAHGWFVGYEGDVAFAVVVEDGQSGSGAAAPLAKDFLNAL